MSCSVLAFSDRTAKVWKDFKLAYTLEGHEQSVWAVLALEGDQDLVLTGKHNQIGSPFYLKGY